MPAAHPPASEALLIGIRTVLYEGGAATRISRQTWALQVLAEQLYLALPFDSPAGKAIHSLVDPKRGITSTAVRRATDDLVRSSFLVAHGEGEDAVWEISEARRTEVDAMFNALSAQELTAARHAAHDAVAISEAWSKTFRASTPPKSVT